MKKRAVTVTLPAPHKAQIKCPICKGNKCVVCKMTGSLAIDVAPKIPIQRAHIIKYVMENMQDVSQELTRMYGLVPEIGTKEVVVVNEGQYEIVQVSSLGGACWIVNRLDELETPRYFTALKDLKKFKEGWMS
jgi:hypothetical protein|tara:strand:+ start:2570 stop:2968 length:399 start_codon:yes stop_codon:yes gene_type:complete